MGWVDTVKEILTLTTEVERLATDVADLNKAVREQNDRIVKLEAASELTVEKARNEALKEVMDVHRQLAERMVAIEGRMDRLGSLGHDEPPRIGR